MQFYLRSNVYFFCQTFWWFSTVYNAKYEIFHLIFKKNSLLLIKFYIEYISTYEAINKTFSNKYNVGYCKQSFKTEKLYEIYIISYTL